MRFIPTKFHAPLDYIVGAALIAAPWIFQFSEHTAATVVPIVLGIGLIAYSLFTNYELGVWKVAPMAVHNMTISPPAVSWRPRRGSSASPMTRPTSGFPIWSWGSPRSSSASPPSNWAATRTARVAPRRQRRPARRPERAAAPPPRARVHGARRSFW
jgi:hypothetical protein